MQRDANLTPVKVQHAPRVVRPGLVAVALCVAGACSDADLYKPDDIPKQPNKVSFTGTVCTDNPAERSFPLRVVFLVDASPNLPVALPEEIALLQLNRVNAVRDTVSLLRAPDSAFALVRYGGQSFVTPDGGFTPNTTEIAEAAGALTVPVNCTADGCRRLGQAFQLASTLITGDLLSTPRGPRSRTKFVVVVVHAGETEDNVLCRVGAAGCDPALILEQRVRDLRSFVLDNGGADFQLHALDVASLSTDAAVRDATANELRRMTFAGAGEYQPVCARDAATGELRVPGCGAQNLTLQGIQIQSARNVFLQKSFIVSNFSAIHAVEGVAVADSDQDGIADTLEADYGTDPTRKDTDGDGISDNIELSLSTVGLNPLVADDPVQCSSILPEQRLTLDTDGDGLKDCEEALLRLDATLFDSDADGTPDPLEVTYGTNFLEDDGLDDPDFDGVPNNVELRAHTDPRSSDAKARAELSYLYRDNDLGIRDILFSSQPRQLSGVFVEDVSAFTTVGNGTLSFTRGGNGRGFLAWRDPGEVAAGAPVQIDGDGVYRLPALCSNKPGRDCAAVDLSITVSVVEAILPPVPLDEFLRVSSAERQCTSFRVRNVTLVETLAADGRPAGFNDIRIFFGQVPGEVPGAFPIFRVAQFPFTFLAPETKIPDVANQVVDDFNFVLFE